ncbi:MAG: DMT family transporter [Phycisphaerales bacterium]
MNLVYVALAMLGGMVMPIQAGMNRELGARLGSPLYATLNNFVGGTALMVVACALAGAFGWARFTPAGVSAAPWWSWLGGVCGCTLVLTATIAVSRIGSVGLVAAIVAGQLLCSLVVDQFGLLGHAVRAITPTRVLGIGLLVAGVYLVQRDAGLGAPAGA